MSNLPLAERLRPTNLKEFIGQEHLVGENGIVTKLIQNFLSHSEVSREGRFPSLIFWGPPGSGKTTLARIIANELKRPFYEFSAVSASIKEIEKIMKKGELFPPIVVIDEIHRFNKAQQARLLPYVERGDITLIGATTENPSFEVISPLMSRCRVLVLNQLTEEELKIIAKRGLKDLKVRTEPKAIKFLIESSNGDARVLLNVLEIASNLTTKDKKVKGANLFHPKGGIRSLTVSHIEQALQRRQYTFDKMGEDYYNVISAYIKSLRASNIDAALYYLARMVEAGQDPLYIARRMVIFASEDIGMAQPTALVVANEVFRACEEIGYPECAINLAHGTVYLASAKKDRSAYDAYFRALDDVKKHGNLPIPLKIRNAPTKLMRELGYGKDYEKYTKESLLPDKIKGKKYYNKPKGES